MSLKLSAVSLGALVLMTGWANAQPPAPAAPTATVQPVSTEAVPVASPKTDPAPEKVVKICHYEEVSGSMIKKRVCH